MATLEDRLLGEKTHYYCSSSEDENEPEEGANNKIINDTASSSVVQVPNEWEGSSTNTGPKGVLKDWQRYKQLETEQRKEQERERIVLAKKLTMSCRSHLDEEKIKNKEGNTEDNVDTMLEDDVLQKYIMKRMEEMMENTSIKKQFGYVTQMNTRTQFLNAIDNEDKDVTVIVHLYVPNDPPCEAMNDSLISLCGDYPEVKFCAMEARNAGLSEHFQGSGLPTLLVYKGGHMLGNFVRLTDDFGDEFFAMDVESYLIEHGMLIDKNLKPPGLKTIRGTDKTNDEDSD